MDYKLDNNYAAVEQGVLRGNRERDGVAAFLGVPYAMPPLGEYRFRPPQPAAPWIAPRNATQYGGESLQAVDNADLSIPGTLEYKFGAHRSEDCLYLNVWTPARSETERLPVFFWVHGGGFLGGAGGRNIYAGDELAKQGMVVVTINYRLSIFGFLSHPALDAESEQGASGNYGLLDQLAALRWVRDNIAAFGGDPGNITLAGQSAGAIAVSGHVLSPLSKGLFRRACLQSGGLYLNGFSYRDKKDVQATAERFFERNGIQSLAELRAMPALKLLELSAQERWQPCVDGLFFPKATAELALERGYDGELLVGCTSDEWLSNASFKVVPDRLRAYLEAVCGEDGARELLAAYPFETPEEAIAAHIAITSDHMFITTLRTAEAASSGSVYAYYFSRRVDTYTPGLRGAAHGLEIPYMFGHRGLGALGPWEHRAWDDRDATVSAEMVRYWANFAKGGDPNGEGLPAWPEYQRGGEILELGEATRPIDNPALEKRLALIRRLGDKGVSFPIGVPEELLDREGAPKNHTGT